VFAMVALSGYQFEVRRLENAFCYAVGIDWLGCGPNDVLGP